MTATERTRSVVEIEGRESVTVPLGPGVAEDALPEGVAVETRQVGFECASGEWLGGEWTGVPALSLLAAAEVPPETTHALLRTTDGFVACVSLSTLDGGLVAIAEAERPPSEFPRFVAPGLPGPRAVKSLATITPVSLAPGERAETYETLPV